MHWFIDPIRDQYADFNGRATRQQYWMFVLVYFLLYVGASIVIAVTGLKILMPLLILASLGIAVPAVALAARRLHDIGMSGWWQLIQLIPFGAFVLIFFFIKDSEAGTNAYGPDPKGNESAANAADPMTPEEPTAVPAEGETAPTNESNQDNQQNQGGM